MTNNKLDIVIGMVAVGMILYHLTNVYYSFVGSLEHKWVHLGFALTLVFLTAIKNSKRNWFLVLPILASLGCLAYLKINLERLQFEMGFPLPADMIISFILIAVVFWACQLSFGFVLPIVATFLLLYGFFGGYLKVAAILTVREVITSVCLTFGSYDMFGKILGISANVIFLFIVYSGLLQSLKGTDFFNEIGKIIGRYSKSGPAMTAVVSSAFMGMTCGQTSPNIAVTGAFTIPLMKKVGYTPAVAGSIEAAASGGGQIMPPIMGAGAFVMADILGVSYSRIILMAAIPALLYFSSLAIYVHLHALKHKVIPLGEKVDLRRLYATAPLFVIPLGLILFLLFIDYPPMLAAFWAIASLALLSCIRKETRPSREMIVKGCIFGATVAARVAIAAATLGPIIALMTKTGLGLKIGFSVDIWSGGSIFLGLIILMFAVIVLGLEVPTVAAYLIAAIVAVPVLIRLGLNPFQAHMFCFCFGAFSSLTPPVGMGAIVASKLAGAPYIKTALHAINAAVAAYLVPYVFAFNGDLLLLTGASLQSVLMSVAIVLLGLLFVQACFVGHFLTGLNLAERLMMLIGALGLLVFAAIKSYPFLSLCLLSFFAVLWQLRKKTHMNN